MNMIKKKLKTILKGHMIKKTSKDKNDITMKLKLRRSDTHMCPLAYGNGFIVFFF